MKISLLQCPVLCLLLKRLIRGPSIKTKQWKAGPKGKTPAHCHASYRQTKEEQSPQVPLTNLLPLATSVSETINQ